jgi:hypothetical protein
MAPLLAILMVYALFNMRDVARLVGGLGLLVVFLIALMCAGFWGTYVRVVDGRIRIVKFYLFRSSIDIRTITAIRYRALGTETLDSLYLDYGSASGRPRSAIVGSIASFGRRQIGEIVSYVVKSNPSVQVDERVSSLVSKPFIYER